MKKFTWLVFSLFFAVCGWADNIKMVSYFPIPYASYSDLKVTDTCDVGLLNECILDVQNLKVEKSSASVPNNDLNTGAFFFIYGNIFLNYTGSATSQISSENLFVGDVYETQSRANLNVGKDLVIGGSFLTNDQTITSLYGQEATIKGLNLKGYNDTWLEFPECDDPSKEISWANLKINGEEGIYLICGKNEKIQCDASTKPTDKEVCNTCGERYRNVKCNTATGKWETGAWSTCSKSEMICKCTKHPVDLGQGLTPVTDYCCVGDTLYNSSGQVWEQGNGMLCCRFSGDRYDEYGEYIPNSATCTSGGGGSTGGCSPGFTNPITGPCGLSVGRSYSCSKFSSLEYGNCSSCSITINSSYKNCAGGLEDYSASITAY